MLDNVRESIINLLSLDSSVTAIEMAYIKHALQVRCVDGDY